MADLNVVPPAREWSSQDRSLVGWLAALPAAGSAIFTLTIFPTEPRFWPVAFLFAAMGAYATAFVGVMPILFAFRRYRWTRLVHYGVAGFTGVLMPWFIVGASVEYLSEGGLQARIGAPLLLAASIGAVMAIAFGWRQHRQA